MPDAVHLSSIAGSPLLDSSGARLGRVEDVVARLDTGVAQPLIVGLKARIGGRELFVPIDRIEHLDPGAVRTRTTKLNLARLERRPGEVLLRQDVLGRSLIDVTNARLVVAREVELVSENGVWRLAGIDASFGARWRRLLPRGLRGEREPAAFIAWGDLEPFVAHVPTSRLRLAHRRLARLHPAQIADLVEAASHDEGEEILEAVGQDKELEADIFQELDDEHQLEFMRERSDTQVAAVLARMDSDDAADLLMELDQDRRLPVLDQMPAAKRTKVLSLLGHNPETAGGLMNPDFVSVAEHSTVEQALELVRRSEIPADQITTVVVTDADGHLAGTLPVVELIKSPAHTTLSALLEPGGPAVSADADLPEIALLMSDFNLMLLPVVDGDGVTIGVLAVDDVLEHTMPGDWRRRYGAARE
ncbi:MAG TPA: CBS domain-containing protein [Solirubrobacteraceae bacterium]|nr:CBS domain-containing protein [Solirubrobacteraceae bacterium]